MEAEAGREPEVHWAAREAYVTSTSSPLRPEDRVKGRVFKPSRLKEETRVTPDPVLP